eukprot:TRINITY_DN7886_c0_g2_i1.p1 TRINITY_DN7886_c0_g2~~TRINITY_DN7886_c0_g2_i1.p1  ORF type:complete len:804 (+),score=147.66 TRINITY_DN7886_c0_g2_i1:33-2414(+)
MARTAAKGRDTTTSGNRARGGRSAAAKASARSTGAKSKTQGGAARGGSRGVRRGRGGHSDATSGPLHFFKQGKRSSKPMELFAAWNSLKAQDSDVQAGQTESKEGCRRRLLKKQPPPRCPTDTTGLPGQRQEPPRVSRAASNRPRRAKAAPRGHYDVLQVPRSASEDEIMTGYRQRALATHPDRPGGCQEQFRAVVNAFEVLADLARRKHYDQALLKSGSEDGLNQGRYETVDDKAWTMLQATMKARRASREALIRCTHTSSRAETVQVLKNFDDSVLQNLVHWIEGMHSKFMKSGEEEAENRESKSKAQSFTGVYCDSCGRYNRYNCHCSWWGMKVVSQKTFSLAEVIDWHVTLMKMKARAQARISKSKNWNEKMIRNVQAWTGPDGDMSMVPITEDELALAYRTSPTLRLSFVSTVGTVNKQRESTPRTDDLNLAIEFAQVYADFYSKHFAQKTSKQPMRPEVAALLRQLRAQATKITEGDKVDRELREREILHAANSELRSRGQQVDGVDVLPAGVSNRIEWRTEAAAAMELTNLLRFDTTSIRQAMLSIRTFTSEQFAVTRAVLLGKPLPALKAASAAGAGARPKALELEEAPAEEHLLKKPRKSVSSSSKALAASPRAAKDGPSCAGSPLLPSSQIGGQPGAVICATLQHSALPDWCALRACARVVRTTVDAELALTFNDFVYSDHLFQWESRSAYSRRVRPTPHGRLASRLTRFIANPYHKALFAHMDLGMAPMATLQDNEFQEAISKMTRLADIVFPNSGWATGADRARFLSALPPSTSAWGRGRP